jgi:hypothetical protein
MIFSQIICNSKIFNNALTFPEIIILSEIIVIEDLSLGNKGTAVFIATWCRSAFYFAKQQSHKLIPDQKESSIRKKEN